jgi:UDP-N-acetylmuramoyl-tripeptide--D-alanyl-D-alanine ligase
VFSALASAAIGRHFGVSDAEIVRGIAGYAPVGSRCAVIDTGYIKIIDDSYNANPNSMKAALRSLSTLSGRRVAILGDMKELGRDSIALHREIGVAAAENVDCLICCGEMAEYIFKGFISTGSEIEAWHFPLKDAMFSVLSSLIKQGDNVLVKASHSMNFAEVTDALQELQ